MSPLWTSVQAERATGGQALGGHWNASGISIDTRTLAPGDLFVALKDRRDGHDFVRQALEKGAAAALVSRRPEDVPENAPLLVVEDVLRALEAMAKAARARSGARVCAITGSVGKTSTKEMLRVILGGQGKVHAAEKSFNNHWGVPLTLARMPADADFALIEIGMNHPGEIAPLARLARPHVALITAITGAHMEAFGSLREIAEEKAAVFSGLVPGGAAIINADLEGSPLLEAIAHGAGARIVRFGEAGGLRFHLMEARVTQGVTVVQARRGQENFLFRLNTPGRHFALNGLGALAAAEALGADFGISVCDLGKWRPPAGRGTLEDVILDEAQPEKKLALIDDAYNANPASLAAALDVLAATEPADGASHAGKGRRVAFLGDMLELGDGARDAHLALASLPAMAAVDVVHCAGPLMRALFDELPQNQRGEWAEDAAQLAAGAHRLVGAGDAVLVKGSKGSRISLVVDAIRKLGHPQAASKQGAG